MASDNTLKILIQLGVIGKEDAKAVNDLLKDTESLSKDLSSSQSDAASTAKDFAKETVAADKALRDQGVQLEGSGKLFGVLNRIVPGLGASMHAAFAGPLGPIILVGIAIAEIRERLKDYNDELDAVADAEIKTHVETVAKLKGNWDSGKESLGKYLAELAHVGEDNDPVATAIKREKELEDARIEGSKRLIEQLGKEEQAAIRRNGALNNIPQAKLEEQLQSARNATEAKLKSADDGKPAASIALMQAELFRRQQNQSSLAVREEAARGPAAAAAEKLERNKTELESERKKNSEALEKAQALVDSFEAVKNGTDSVRDQWRIMSAGMTSYGDALKNLTQASTNMENSRQRQRQLENGLSPEAKDAAEKSDALEKARQANLENQKQLKELPAALRQAQAVELLKQNPNADVPSPLGQLSVPSSMPPLQDMTRSNRFTEAKARDNFGQAEAAYERMQQGGHLDSGQFERTARIVSAMSGKRIKNEEMLLSILRESMGSNAARDAAFERELDIIRRQLANTPRRQQG